MIDLGYQIMLTQCHSEQELNAAHDPIAVLNARAALNEMQLERLNLFSSGSIR